MLTTTPSPTPNLEGAPWWVNAGLLALTTVAGVITTVVIRRQNSSPTTPPPPDPNPGPAVPAVPAAMQALPTTADGQLELAKQLVAEVVRDRDETRAELIEAQAMVNRLTARVRDQDVTIARLQQLLLGMPPPPQYPQAPPPPGPRH